MPQSSAVIYQYHETGFLQAISALVYDFNIMAMRWTIHSAMVLSTRAIAERQIEAGGRNNEWHRNITINQKHSNHFHNSIADFSMG